MSNKKDDLKKEVVVTLDQPIMYDYKGEREEATFVTLFPPTSKNLQECAVIKQMFYQAANDFSDGSSNDSDSDSDSADSDSGDLSGDDLMQMFYASKIDINKLFLNCKELFKSGVAKLDGQQKLTAPLLDQIEIDDFEKIVGDYLVNFTLSSILKKMNQP